MILLKDFIIKNIKKINSYNNNGDYMKFDFKKFVIILISTFLIGGLFAFIIRNNMQDYKGLIKPINVPSIVFPIVWSILYLLMSISCYIIAVSDSKEKNKCIIIYYVQLIINSLWTLIFFGFKSYLIAFIWLILLIVFIVIMILNFYNVSKKAAYLQIPYLIWTVFAGYLNLGIYLLNK